MPDMLTISDYSSYLYSIANRQLRSDLRPKVGGSDLVQETLLAAWTTSRNGTIAPDDLRLWLRGILRKRIGRCHRRFITAKKRTVTAECSLVDIADPEDGELAESALVRDELSAALSAAVEQLEPHEREVLGWRLDDELSWHEVGMRLDSTAEAARQVFRRAVAQLRGILSPEFDPGS
jgi:RNA polymerase sigma-70 factor, ECF subfamily